MLYSDKICLYKINYINNSKYICIYLTKSLNRSFTLMFRETKLFSFYERKPIYQRFIDMINANNISISVP